MKKKKLGNLSLNKTIISNFKGNSILGGIDVTKEPPCTVFSDNGPCPTEIGCGTITGPTLTPTCAEGCTLPTIQLSYCNGGIPDPCESVQICA
ncbi:hypothetical protein [uncultured Kordia sp.]|uniref:hypothetical protein n=1 Tax=uncultured Kordia sp. TaxID=507699 RepID=UPI002620E605|nr:hypothetical protein [uncultured Kordia sp.]